VTYFGFCRLRGKQFAAFYFFHQPRAPPLIKFEAAAEKNGATANELSWTTFASNSNALPALNGKVGGAAEEIGHISVIFDPSTARGLFRCRLLAAKSE
jgi:hypothetical protein